MRVVLLDPISQRYYKAPGLWVRRADHARAFDHRGAAREFSRLNDFQNAEPVYRLAPHLKALLKIILSVFFALLVG